MGESFNLLEAARLRGAFRTAATLAIRIRKRKFVVFHSDVYSSVVICGFRAAGLSFFPLRSRVRVKPFKNVTVACVVAPFEM